MDEGNPEYVDGDRARDLEWTDEIVAHTIGAALVDDEGEIVTEFDGEDAVERAERARASARIVFNVDLGEDA